jgi:hypothetical protein
MTLRSLTQTDGRTTRINFPATIPLLLLPYQPVPQTVPNYDYSYKQQFRIKTCHSLIRLILLNYQINLIPMSRRIYPSIW